jgi:hypothetical protein
MGLQQALRDARSVVFLVRFVGRERSEACVSILGTGFASSVALPVTYTRHAAADFRAALRHLGGDTDNLVQIRPRADGPVDILICGELLPGPEPLVDAEERRARIVARLMLALGQPVLDGFSGGARA